MNVAERKLIWRGIGDRLWCPVCEAWVERSDAVRVPGKPGLGLGHHTEGCGFDDAGEFRSDIPRTCGPLLEKAR